MKKMISIIIILIIIFIGMVIYKSSIVKKQEININDVNKIHEYISKIYCWKEITGDALPVFNNINEAPDLWIWEVVKKNLEDYEVEYDVITAKEKSIFGESISKQYPKEGSKSFTFDNEKQKYIATETQTDENDDSYLVNKITKIKDGYEVEIKEYIEDYTNYNENKIEIKNTKEEIIATIDTENIDSKAVEIVKNNIDKFTTKKITLKNIGEKLYVEKVEG